MDNKYKIISAIIPVVALIIFFVWGWIEGTFSDSWFIFLVAGGAFAILSAVKKNNKE